MPSVTIVGVGAIGGWLAGLFDAAGWDVRLLARGASLAAIREHGLRVLPPATQDEAGERIVRGKVSDNPADLGPSDYLVIALKGHDLPPLAAGLAPIVGPDTAVVTAMNGLSWWFTDGFAGPIEGLALDSVDPGGALRAMLPVERVIGCVVHATAATVAPGVVQVIGADELAFGEPSGEATERVERLAAATREAGVKTQVSPNIRLAIWRKLWGNMSMNPISALTRATTGPILDDPQTRELIRTMMTEMAGLGARLGLDLGMTPEERMAITRRLGDFKTSMQRDAEAGRRLEIDPLLGVLIEIADRLGRPAPFMRAVHGLARRLDASTRASRP